MIPDYLLTQTDQACCGFGGRVNYTLSMQLHQSEIETLQPTEPSSSQYRL